jgi:threonylcarbamoyladenosine tRNA methylthiotransferase MtaB
VAIKFPGRIDSKTIKARSAILCGLSRAKRLNFYQRHIGGTVDVLFETRNQQDLFTGLTPNYIRVGVQSGENLANQIHAVALYGAMDGLALGATVDR